MDLSSGLNLIKDDSCEDDDGVKDDGVGVGVSSDGVVGGRTHLSLTASD